MATSDYAERPDVLAFRVRENSDRLKALEEWRRSVDKDDAASAVVIENLQHDMSELVRTVDGLRKVILGFAMTIAGSAIVFALSILAASGRI